MHEGASPPGSHSAYADVFVHLPCERFVHYNMNNKKNQWKTMTVLKILRKSMKLSQEELAEKLGSHVKRIRRCESLNPNQNRELELTVAEWQRFSRLVWDELKLDLPFVPEIRLSNVPSDEFCEMLIRRGIDTEQNVHYDSEQDVQ